MANKFVKAMRSQSNTQKTDKYEIGNKALRTKDNMMLNKFFLFRDDEEVQ